MNSNKLTTKQRILNYLQFNAGWVSGTALEANAENWRTKSSVISRRARELHAEGHIDRLLGPKRTVQYRLANRKQFDPEAYLEFLREEEKMKQGVLL